MSAPPDGLGPAAERVPGATAPPADAGREPGREPGVRAAAGDQDHAAAVRARTGEPGHAAAVRAPTGDPGCDERVSAPAGEAGGDAPPGAQLERTQLSWRRTLVSVTAVALLLARLAAVHLRDLAAAGALAAVGLLWVATVALVRRRVRDVGTPIGRELPWLVTLILLYCAMGTLLLVS